MLNIECSCGQRGYLDWLGEVEKNHILVSLDVDTMGLEYDAEEGIKFTCPHCKTSYSILRVT